jgi:hypothetical protein
MNASVDVLPAAWRGGSERGCSNGMVERSGCVRELGECIVWYCLVIVKELIGCYVFVVIHWSDFVLHAIHIVVSFLT